MPSYHLPTLILPTNVWRFGNPTTNAPDVVCLSNLIPGRRHVIETSPGAGLPSGWLPASYCLLAIDADVRDEAGTGGSPDTVEIPAGSGRFYLVQYIEFVGLGFANQHQQAVLVKIAPFPFPAFGVVHSDLLGISVEVLLPSYNLGEGVVAPLLHVPVLLFTPTIVTTPNVTLVAPIVRLSVDLLAAIVNAADRTLSMPLVAAKVDSLVPTVTTGSGITVVQTVTDHNPTGVSPLVNLTWPVATTTGNTLILILGCTASNLGSVTADPGWTLFQSSFGTNKGVLVFYIPSALPQSNTGQFGGNGDPCSASAWEVSGLDLLAPPDQFNSAGGTTGTTLTSNVTPATSLPDEFLVAGFFCFASGPVLSAPTSGFAFDGQVVDHGNNTFAGLSKIVSATGAYSVDVTASASADWLGVIATFF